MYYCFYVLHFHVTLVIQIREVLVQAIQLRRINVEVAYCPMFEDFQYRFMPSREVGFLQA